MFLCIISTYLWMEYRECNVWVDITDEGRYVWAGIMGVVGKRRDGMIPAHMKMKSLPAVDVRR